MKKFKQLSLLMVLILALSAFAVGCGGGSEDNDNNENVEDKVVIGHDVNFVPFEYKDSETGKYVGFDIDFIEAIAQEAGFNYELEAMSFDGLIPALQADKVDIAIAGMTIKPDREEKVDFAQPYYDAGLHLLVSADNEEINGIEDLEGKVVASKSGTTSYDFSKEVEGVESVTPFKTIVEAYQELDKGAADAVIFDSPAVLQYANDEGKGKVKIVGPLYEGQQYGVALQKDSELTAQVDEAIDTLRENGTYDEIYEKWFGQKPE